MVRVSPVVSGAMSAGGMGPGVDRPLVQPAFVAAKRRSLGQWARGFCGWARAFCNSFWRNLVLGHDALFNVTADAKRLGGGGDRSVRQAKKRCMCKLLSVPIVNAMSANCNRVRCLLMSRACVTRKMIFAFTTVAVNNGRLLFQRRQLGRAFVHATRLPSVHPNSQGWTCEMV